MAKKMSREDKYRLKCEQLVNESWSEVGKFGNEITHILENGPEDERDISIMTIASEAFDMKLTLGIAEEQNIMNADTYIPCGKDISSCDDCEFFTACRHV